MFDDGSWRQVMVIMFDMLSGSLVITPENRIAPVTPLGKRVIILIVVCAVCQELPQLSILVMFTVRRQYWVNVGLS